jgi:CDP-glucose 4,6-dehydratase
LAVWAGTLEGLDLMTARVDPVFWKGKRVLLTGHTGFKGGWLALWLVRMGAQVTGVALPPGTSPNIFQRADVARGLAASLFVDIRDAAELATIVRDAQPEILLHLAAQPIVRRSYAQPVETFVTNVMGTVHVLEALRSVDSARVAVMVTTDKVYSNREWCWPYREEDALGGHDPYSASKAASEMVIESYRKSFLAARGIRVASVRAGNVIGGGDWSVDRLLPDAVRAWQAKQPIEIRRPDAVRPWQHVLDPLHAYLVLAQALWHGTAPDYAYNFGPAAHRTASVRRVVELAQASWCGDMASGSSIDEVSMAGAPVVWNDGTTGPHEAGLLSLETARARSLLDVAPRWGLEESVARTIAWYRSLLAGDDARTLCYADIDAFEAAT